MKWGLPLVLAGAVLITVPVALIGFWPVATSSDMPEDLSKYPNSYYAPKDERLETWDDDRLIRLPGEDDFSYASRMLGAVHNATYHCEAHNYSQSWFTWLSWRTGVYSLIPHNNQGVLDVTTFRCGFCHQRSFILARVLRQSGISSAEVLGLSGHVVTVFTHSSELYALDPDYGIGPVRISGLDNTVGNVDPDIQSRLYVAYQPVASAWGQAFADNIVNFFTSRDDNRYYIFKNLEMRRALQERLFSLERVIESYFIILGVVLTGTGLLMMAFKIQDLRKLKDMLNRTGKNA